MNNKDQAKVILLLIIKFLDLLYQFFVIITVKKKKELVNKCINKGLKDII